MIKRVMEVTPLPAAGTGPGRLTRRIALFHGTGGTLLSER